MVAAVLLASWADRRAESASGPFLERLERDAYLLSGPERKPAVVGSRLDPGQGIETSRAFTRVLVRFPDRSHLELGTLSMLSDVRLQSGGGVRAQLAWPASAPRPPGTTASSSSSSAPWGRKLNRWLYPGDAP